MLPRPKHMQRLSEALEGIDLDVLWTRLESYIEASKLTDADSDEAYLTYLYCEPLEFVLTMLREEGADKSPI